MLAVCQPDFHLSGMGPLDQAAGFFEHGVDHFFALLGARGAQGEFNGLHQVRNGVVGDLQFHDYLRRNAALAFAFASSMVLTRPTAMPASERSAPSASMAR